MLRHKAVKQHYKGIRKSNTPTQSVTMIHVLTAASLANQQQAVKIRSITAVTDPSSNKIIRKLT